VGKGRQIAALCKEFFETGGTRVLWVSTSNDLRFDARRDLADVGAADIECFPDKKDAMPKGPLSQHISKGVVFVTYSLLVSRAGAGVKRENPAGKKAKEPAGQGMDFGPVPKGTRCVALVEHCDGDLQGSSEEDEACRGCSSAACRMMPRVESSLIRDALWNKF
jgi:hypothetical protein